MFRNLTDKSLAYFTPPRRAALLNAAMALVTSLLVWQFFDGLVAQRLHENMRVQVGEQINSYGVSLTQAVNQRLDLVHGLTAFVETEMSHSGEVSGDVFEIFAAGIYPDANGIRDIALAPDGVMAYVYPYEENKSVLGYEPARDSRPNVREEVHRAITTGEVVLSLPYELIQGGTGVIARQAIFWDGKYWGLANVVIDVPPLLEDAGLSPLPAGLQVALKDQAGEVFYGSPAVFDQDPVTTLIPLPEGQWELAGAPGGNRAANYRNSLWFARGLAYLSIALLVALVYFITGRQERLRRAVTQKTQQISITLRDLRERETLLGAIAENFPNAFLGIVEKDCSVSYASGQEFKKYDLNPDDYIGAKLEDIFGEQASIFEEHCTRAFKGREQRFEFINNDQVFLITGVPLQTTEGEAAQVLAVAENITNRKQAEAEIRMQSDELAAINSLSREIGHTLVPDEVASAAVQGLLDATSADVTFLLLREEDDLNPKAIRFREPGMEFDDFPTHKLGQCLCGLAAQEGRAIYSTDIFKDTRCTWDECKKAGLRSAAALPLYSGNEVFGVFGLGSTQARDFEQQSEYLETLASEVANGLQNAILHDRIERHAAELEQRVRERTAALRERVVEVEQLNSALANLLDDLQAANFNLAQTTTRLQQANEELESFTYSVSHDLRAPLRAIDGFSRILLEDYHGQLDEEGQRLLNVVHENTRKMDALINDLLALSRVSRAEKHYTHIDMTALAQSTFEEIAELEATKKFDVTIQDLPAATGDSGLMRQVWSNLFSNAVKYTQPKRVRKILVSGRREEDMNVYAVQDTGVGFDPEYTDKLFGVFQRLHSEEEFPGTGVGLAIVKRIILRHGGRVWAEGKLNSGATFYFALPREEDSDDSQS